MMQLSHNTENKVSGYNFPICSKGTAYTCSTYLLRQIFFKLQKLSERRVHHTSLFVKVYSFRKYFFPTINDPVLLI